MRVTQGMIANNVRFNLQRGLSRLDNLAHKLSTGKSFHRPLENPVGNYKVMRYNTVINYNDRYRTNMNESRGWLESTEVALMDGLQLLQRIRELTVYSANDPLTDLEREAIAQEVKEYYEAFVGMANKDFNGLHIFAGHQTREKPYIEQKIYAVDGLPEGAKLEAEGMRQGDYNITFEELTGAAGATLTTSQQLLQGTSNSIIGKGSWEIVDADTVETNASIQLEIKEINHETGDVTYDYSSHEYYKDGDYSKHTGQFTLKFNDDPNEDIQIGSLTVNVTGLEQYAGRDIADIRVGDKAVLNLQAAREDGNHQVNIGADFREGGAVIDGVYREGSAALAYNFNDDAFNSEVPSLKFHTLNLYNRSGHYGKIYENTIKMDYTELDPDTTVNFSFDPLGYATYHGDEGHRRQEIAPHQQIRMNLDGNRVFGNADMDHDLFATVKKVYWALMDNDRNELGDVALGELDDVIENLLLRTTEVGARLNRVEAMDSMLFEETIFLRDMRSNIEDIDMAEIMTEYMMQESVYQAALATTARMMQPTLIDFMR